MKIIFFFIVIGITTLNKARDEDTAHVWEGNLALPISQQPTPLFAFGQNIVAKGDVQLFVEVDYLRSDQKKFAEVVPGILFGVTDNLSLFFNIPVATRFTFNQNFSSGIEDIWLQTEYAFYNRDRERYALQATLVGTVFFPSGSSKKNPSTGIDALTILIGNTISYTGVTWYAYVSPGGIFPLNHQSVNSRFLYQAGLGRNIAYSSKQWLLTGIIELFGVASRNTASNCTPHVQSLFCDGSTGAGSSLYIGPTFWFATKRFILQAGIVVSVLKKETISTDNNKYWAAVNVGWKFN